MEEKLKTIDINNLTPIEALNIISELKKSINELSITYAKQPTKLIEVLLQYQQKTLDNNRFTLKRLLDTIFTALATKFTRK